MSSLFVSTVNASHMNAPSSRYPYPQSNQPSSPYRTHNRVNSDYYYNGEADDQEEDKAEAQENDERQPKCFFTHRYKNAYPAGLQEVPAVELKVGEATVKSCGQACCELGPEKCQYVWMVGTRCLAVACSPSQKELCRPVQLEEDAPTKVTTHYYQIGFSDPAAPAGELFDFLHISSWMLLVYCY